MNVITHRHKIRNLLKKEAFWAVCYEEGQGNNTASTVLMTLSADIGILSKELAKDLSSRMPHDLCQRQPFLEAVFTDVQNYGA